MPAPEEMLKTQIRKSKYSMREVADYLKRPYGTVACWMNGFAPLPGDARTRIQILLESNKDSDQRLETDNQF